MQNNLIIEIFRNIAKARLIAQTIAPIINLRLVKVEETRPSNEERTSDWPMAAPTLTHRMHKKTSRKQSQPTSFLHSSPHCYSFQSVWVRAIHPSTMAMLQTPSKYVTLVSGDGFEFVVVREAALVSPIIKGMLDVRSA